MKLSLLTCGLTMFVSCATPAPTDAWSEGTLAIAITLEQRAQSLIVGTSQVFRADNSRRDDALAACHDIENTLRAHAQAWRALFAYSATIENELSAKKLDHDKVDVVAHAFNDLHGKLLQTKIAVHFGVDLEAHRQVVVGIRDASSVAQALVVASYGIDSICQTLASATASVGEKVDALNARLLDLYAIDNAPLMQQRQVLLERQQRYQTAVNPAYDVEFELQQVAIEIADNQNSLGEMRTAANSINAMCLANKLLLQQCISACFEWGLCNQALSQSSSAAMQNFRLFEERAEVISRIN